MKDLGKQTACYLHLDDTKLDITKTDYEVKKDPNELQYVADDFRELTGFKMRVRYTGYLRNGKPAVKGSFIDAYDSEYSGSYDDNGNPVGEWTIIEGDKTYVGELNIKYNCNGQGKWLDKNNKILSEGIYNDGRLESGIWNYNGEIYRGKFNRGRLCNHGSIEYKNGSIVFGKYNWDILGELTEYRNDKFKLYINAKGEYTINGYKSKFNIEGDYNQMISLVLIITQLSSTEDPVPILCKYSDYKKEYDTNYERSVTYVTDKEYLQGTYAGLWRNDKPHKSGCYTIKANGKTKELNCTFDDNGDPIGMCMMKTSDGMCCGEINKNFEFDGKIMFYDNELSKFTYTGVYKNDTFIEEIDYCNNYVYIHSKARSDRMRYYKNGAKAKISWNDQKIIDVEFIEYPTINLSVNKINGEYKCVLCKREFTTKLENLLNFLKVLSEHSTKDTYDSESDIAELLATL